LRLAEHDEMVERFATDRSDEPLNVAVLPRRAWCAGVISDPHCTNAAGVRWTECAVAVANQVMRRFVPGKRVRVLRDLADSATSRPSLILGRKPRQSSWESSAAASLKSASAKPSVMLATTGTRPALASSRRLCAARRRARLVAPRNSHARAC
jgi:hypothetical protein